MFAIFFVWHGILYHPVNYLSFRSISSTFCQNDLNTCQDSDHSAPHSSFQKIRSNLSPCLPNCHSYIESSCTVHGFCFPVKSIILKFHNHATLAVTSAILLGLRCKAFIVCQNLLKGAASKV